MQSDSGSVANINYLVDQVINKNFDLRKLEKHGEITSFSLNTTLDEPKKEFKNVLTELVTNEFIKSSEQILNFLKLVCNSYNEAISIYLKNKNMKSDDILFIYKGGNIMRFIFNEVLKEYPKHVADKIQQYFSDSFKRSDADFGIYIRPTINNYQQVYLELTNLVFLIQNQIRNVFMSDLSKWFEFYRLNTAERQKILEKYTNKLNETSVVMENKAGFHGKFTGLIIDGDKFNTNKEYIPKEDSISRFTEYVKFGNRFDADLKYISEFPTELGKEQKLIFQNRQVPMFVRSNEVYFSKGIIVFFNLIRTKFVFTGVFNDNQIVRSDGELIDVTISRREDQYSSHFYEHLNTNITSYQIGPDFKFNAYSISYLVSDLEKILFDQSEFPWEDKKYTKRLKRLIFFYFLTVLLHYNTNKDESKYIYFEKMKELLTIIKNQTNLVIKQTLLKIIKESNTDNDVNPFLPLILNMSKIITDPKYDTIQFSKYIDTLVEYIDFVLNILKEMNSQQVLDIHNLSEGKEFAGGHKDPYYEKYMKFKNKYMRVKPMK